MNKQTIIDEKVNLCKCGCGQLTKLGKVYIYGHSRKDLTKQNNESVKSMSEKLSGRTKENDESVRRRAEKMSGRTKETHEGVRRQSQKMTGKNSPNYGKPPWNKGLTKYTDPSIKKISDNHTDMSGELNPNYGKVCWNKGLTKETNKSLKSQSEKLSGKNNPYYGVHRYGENSPTWQGGKSFEPYCFKFNFNFKERVREFFNRRCYVCGKTEQENGRRLCVHHVGYDKDVCCNDVKPLFVSLCKNCHSKTHGNRQYWQQYFTNRIMTEFNGKCFYSKQEM